MSELGQRLKQTREEQGMSIEDLQKATKIQKRYLQAIEEGRFDTLPGKFYARAFVKSYADAVGIDTDELFDEHSKELPNPQSGNVNLPPRIERTKKSVKRPRGKFVAILPTAIAIAFIFIIGIGVWVMAQQWGADEAEGVAPDEQEQPFEGEIVEDLPEASEDPAEEVPAPPAQEEEPARTEPAEVQTQQLTEIQSSGNHSFYELSNTDKFVVSIKFTGTSYVGIKNGKGKSFYATEARQNDELSYDFTGEEEIEFNFGASPYVQMFINEEPFQFPLDKIHQKVTITFKPNAN